MLKTSRLPFLALLFAIVVCAKTKDLPNQAELDAITARGRLLAEYDTASWHATDAVQALKPPPGVVGRYIAKKTGGEWVVAFGRLNPAGDRFLVAYEATQGDTLEVFTVKTFDPPREDTGFYLNAERAIRTVLADFPRENRPYNMSVLPANATQLYVYIYPGSTVDGMYLLGGDARYLTSNDGTAIVEKRQLHRSILEYPGADNTKKITAGFHTHVLSDVPEDTDVMYVLTRKPAVPEYVRSRAKIIWVIQVDGTIRRGK